MTARPPLNWRWVTAAAFHVRNAQLAQWNYILVAGEEEMQSGTVDVRTRDTERHGKMRVD